MGVGIKTRVIELLPPSNNDSFLHYYSRAWFSQFFSQTKPPLYDNSYHVSIWLRPEQCKHPKVVKRKLFYLLTLYSYHHKFPSIPADIDSLVTIPCRTHHPQQIIMIEVGNTIHLLLQQADVGEFSGRIPILGSSLRFINVGWASYRLTLVIGGISNLTFRGLSLVSIVGFKYHV